LFVLYFKPFQARKGLTDLLLRVSAWNS